jgi:hypothetical protein
LAGKVCSERERLNCGEGGRRCNIGFYIIRKGEKYFVSNGNLVTEYPFIVDLFLV